jgi:hypothetical protein
LRAYHVSILGIDGGLQMETLASGFSQFLPVSDSLRAGSRFRGLTSDRLRMADMLVLIGAGVTAALATAWLDFGWRVPGHAILRTVLPLAFGLALAPRRGSGVVMSASAGLSMMVLRLAGTAGGGAGALASLFLTGPLLDVASRWSRRGWRLYLAFAAAGLASNLAAFAVRWATKAGSGGGGGGGPGGGRTLAEWQPQAMVTYAVCGLLAGLIGAAICFRATPRNSEEEERLS